MFKLCHFIRHICVLVRYDVRPTAFSFWRSIIITSRLPFTSSYPVWSSPLLASLYQLYYFLRSHPTSLQTTSNNLLHVHIDLVVWPLSETKKVACGRSFYIEGWYKWYFYFTGERHSAPQASPTTSFRRHSHFLIGYLKIMSRKARNCFTHDSRSLSATVVCLHLYLFRLIRLSPLLGKSIWPASSSILFDNAEPCIAL